MKNIKLGVVEFHTPPALSFPQFHLRLKQHLFSLLKCIQIAIASELMRWLNFSFRTKISGSEIIMCWEKTILKFMLFSCYLDSLKWDIMRLHLKQLYYNYLKASGERLIENYIEFFFERNDGKLLCSIT
jgi:hypothetical protein